MEREGEEWEECCSVDEHVSQARWGWGPLVLPALPLTLSFPLMSESLAGLGEALRDVGHSVDCAGRLASPGDGPQCGHPMGSPRAPDLLHSLQHGELLALSPRFPPALL